VLNQIYEIAKIVYTDSLRKNLIIASILIMLPLLIAAWLFEASNPGFQTGFILDAGSGLMSFLSIIVVAVLSFEQLFWAKEQQTPWFYFSRLKSRILFPIGKYLGICSVLGTILLVFSILLSLIIFFTSGSYLFAPIKIAFILWAEYSLLLSVLILFSTFLSKLMSVGMMITVFFIAQSTQFFRGTLPNWLSEILLTLLPNTIIFEAAIDSNDITPIFLTFLYALFMSAFYITLSGWVLKRKDL
jgi:hypothetical protein